MGFHPHLGLFNGVTHHAVLDGLAVVHAHAAHEAFDAVGAENPEQIILQREIEAGGARVSLAAGAPPELIVDAPGFMALSGENVQAALLHHPLAQNDVGAPAGHVGGNGDMAELPRLGHDFGFFFVVLGVQDLVLDVFPPQELAQVLRLLNGGGAHQYRLAPLVAFFDFFHCGLKFFLTVLIDDIGEILPDHFLVGGNHHHFQIIDLLELLGFSVRGAGHAGELVVHAEVILEGDGGQGLVFVFDAHALLGLQSLVQAVGVAPSRHEATGKLVHDDDLAFLDDVLIIPLEELVGLEGLVQMVQHLDVARIINIVEVQEFFGPGDAFLGDEHAAGLFVHREVLVLLELLGHPVQNIVEVGGFLCGPRNDQRGTGLVDENGVHFVHDGIVKFPLDIIRQVELHVIPQIVEAELVVGAIGDIGIVSPTALLVAQAVQDGAHPHAQGIEDIPHPVGIPAGQVVVHRDDVDPFPGEGIEIGGEHGHQGFTFTSFHFRNLALMEDNAADELHVEGSQSQGPQGGLPGHREGLGQQIVQGLPLV